MRVFGQKNAPYNNGKGILVTGDDPMVGFYATPKFPLPPNYRHASQDSCVVDSSFGVLYE